MAKLPPVENAAYHDQREPNLADAGFSTPLEDHLQPIELESSGIQSHIRGSLIGKKLNNFLIEEKIGQGGFGAVYRAKQIFLDKPFAIKFLHIERQMDAEVIKRFQREARALAELRHDNIVQMTDFGLLNDYGFYLTMEYLDGVNLFQLLQEEQEIPIERTSRIIQQLCDALAFVHKKGVIHRDLKPGNIFLVRDEDGQEKVKLIDFGIATIQGEAALTRKGNYLGTASFASPEQAKGAPLDGRSDLYSLSIILYVLLTQRLPFMGNNPIHIIYQQLNTPPPALQESAPWRMWCDELECFIQRALAKEPNDRPSDGHAYWRECAEAFRAQLQLGRTSDPPTPSEASPLPDRTLAVLKAISPSAMYASAALEELDSLSLYRDGESIGSIEHAAKTHPETAASASPLGAQIPHLSPDFLDASRPPQRIAHPNAHPTQPTDPFSNEANPTQPTASPASPEAQRQYALLEEIFGEDPDARTMRTHADTPPPYSQRPHADTPPPYSQRPHPSQDRKFFNDPTEEKSHIPTLQDPDATLQKQKAQDIFSQKSNLPTLQDPDATLQKQKAQDLLFRATPDHQAPTDPIFRSFGSPAPAPAPRSAARLPSRANDFDDLPDHQQVHSPRQPDTFWYGLLGVGIFLILLGGLLLWLLGHRPG